MPTKTLVYFQRNDCRLLFFLFNLYTVQFRVCHYLFFLFILKKKKRCRHFVMILLLLLYSTFCALQYHSITTFIVTVIQNKAIILFAVRPKIYYSNLQFNSSINIAKLLLSQIPCDRTTIMICDTATDTTKRPFQIFIYSQFLDVLWPFLSIEC